MKEFLFLTIFYVLFLVSSIRLKKQLIKLKPIWLVAVSLISYLVLIWFYIDFILQVHYFLRDHHIYYEFGHAELGLLLLGLAFYVSAIILIINIIYKKSIKLKDVK